MIGICGRHAERAIEFGQARFAGLRLRFLNPALHLADGVEILVDARAVGRADLAPQIRDILRDPVEDTRVLLHFGAAVRRIAAIAE